jgi:hypothetical protein
MNLFLQYPLLLIAITLTLLGVCFSVITTILKASHIRSLRKSLENAIIKKTDFSQFSVTEPLKIYISSAMEINEQCIVKSSIERMYGIHLIHYGHLDSQRYSYNQYKDTINDADIFIVILETKHLTRLKDEYGIAAELGKPIIAFVDTKCDCDKVNEDIGQFLTTIPLNLVFFTSHEQLKYKIYESIYNLLINAYRQDIH